MRIRKLVNALIPNATPSDLVTGAALTAVERFGETHGGLGVGGTIDISDDAVSFTSNGFNMAFHVGLEVVRIPLADICSVRREFGWLTGIVVVEHIRGEFRFRCFGARSIAARLSQCVKKQPPTGAVEPRASLEPESRFVVRLSASEVVCERPDGKIERVGWADPQKVEVVTTGDGPFAPDVFWVLHGTDGGCAVPQGAKGDSQLLERLQALPGFDNHAFIEAMSSTSDKRFLCWRRAA